MTARQRHSVPVRQLKASAYTVPTDLPESDGTCEWDSTTLVLVEIEAGGERGIGYTYADACLVPFIQQKLAPVVLHKDAMAIPAAWVAMVQAIRNLGRPGLCSMAIAAIDSALWDLKARLLGVPLLTLLGQVRSSIPVYGSGGFTSYSIEQLQRQLAGWVEAGIGRVKMKIGRDAENDLERVRAAREAIGPETELFVDANGAYNRKQAMAQADSFSDLGVSWFEEPVSSDDLSGLRLIRDRGPAGMQIAAGEYAYQALYFRRMLEAGAVDVLQADATRCAGITGFLQAGALCEAFEIPLSAHTAPSLHAHACCAVGRACHLEYFHDHVRIEQLLFDGVLSPIGGALHPDLTRPGLGLEFRKADAAQYALEPD